MSPDDARKAKRIEALLVSNHVDTSRLDVEVIGSSVYISGELRLFEYDMSGKRLKDPAELALTVKKTCELIKQEIRRMFEVYHVQWQLRNWENVGSNWKQKRTLAVA